jgi:hypothetical protein
MPKSPTQLNGLYSILRHKHLCDSSLITVTQIFLGYPHRWHSVYDMEGKIARLVFSGPKAPQSNALLHVKTLARAVIECNEAFVESKIVMSTEILSVRSGLTDLKESVRSGKHVMFELVDLTFSL